MFNFISIGMLILGNAADSQTACVVKYEAERLGALNIKICQVDILDPKTNITYIASFKHTITNLSTDEVVLFLDKRKLHQGNLRLFRGKDWIFGMPEFTKIDDTHGVVAVYRKVLLQPHESISFELKLRDLLPILKLKDEFGSEAIYYINFNTEFTFLRKGEAGDARAASVRRMQESNNIHIWQKDFVIAHARIR